jgi:hypothetical protein
MKKAIVALIAMVAFAGTAFGADVIEMKKNVKFNHKAHQGKAKCAECHGDKAGKIEGFGKAWAHDNDKGCKKCHAKQAKNPAPGCKDCHK